MRRFFARLSGLLGKRRAERELAREVASVAIVNQRLAERAWPGEDPIGKRFEGFVKNAEVVGVVGDSKYADVREEPRLIAYGSFDQGSASNGTLAVRCRRPLGAVERDVRQIVAAAARSARCWRWWGSTA